MRLYTIFFLFPTRTNQGKPIVKLCQILLPNRKSRSFTLCGVCGLQLRLYNTSTAAVNHACAHLGKPMFACRHCDWKFSTKAALSVHLKRMHDLNTAANNCEDLSNQYTEDIMDMLKQCFGSSKEQSEKMKLVGRKRLSTVSR